MSVARIAAPAACVLGGLLLLQQVNYWVQLGLSTGSVERRESVVYGVVPALAALLAVVVGAVLFRRSTPDSYGASTRTLRRAHARSAPRGR